MLKTTAGMYPYGICLSASVLWFVLASLISSRIRGNRAWKTVLQACSIELLCALAASRLVFCAVNYTKYFLYEPGLIPVLTEGGMSMWGALFGLFAGAYLYSRISKVNTARLFDIMTPGALGIVIIMRFAETYTLQSGGKEIQWYFLENTVFSCPDDWGYPVFAVYRAEAFCAAALLILSFLLLFSRKTHSGTAAVVCMSLLSAFQCVFECMKDYGYLYIYYIRITQAMAVLMMLITLILGLIKTFRTHTALSVTACIAFLFGCGVIVKQSFAIDTPEHLELNLAVMLAGALISEAAVLCVHRLSLEDSKKTLPLDVKRCALWAIAVIAALVIALPFLIPSGMNV